MVRNIFIESLSVEDTIALDPWAVKDFDKQAKDFEAYWQARAREFPEKFFWIDRSKDDELRKFYQAKSDERFAKNNGGKKKW